MTGPPPPPPATTPPGPRRPYDAFVADAYDKLVGDVTRFAAKSIPGGVPPGFEVRDFVQHALMQLLDLYDSRANEAAAYAYARTTATNALLDAARAARRRQAPEWLAGVAALHGRREMTTEQAAELRERNRRVHEALDRLPDRQRQVVRLLYMEGFSRAHAAQIMGTSVVTVKSLAQRARVSLAAMLRGASLVAALHAAARRSRRPIAVAATSVPRMAAVLCLAVAQQPVTVPIPDADAYVVPVEAKATGTPRSPHLTSTAPIVARPPAIRRPTPAVQRRSATSRSAIQESRLLAPPQAGGCVDETCLGHVKRGDELCADTGQEPVELCANQTLLGICPTAERVAHPGTRCTRYSDPKLDP